MTRKFSTFHAALPKVTLALAAAATCVMVPSALYAQVTSGNLVGIVKDSSGAAVASASVTVRNVATNVASKINSNAQGEYRVNNLLPGTYAVEVTAPGFSSTTVNNVTIQLNSTATADVNLSVGGAGTTVEVSSADAGLVLDTTTQNLTQTFEMQEIASLPVAATGSGVLNLSLLSPGVGSTGGIGIGGGPSIAGQRPRNNNFTIEGIDNNDKAVAGPLVYIPNDDVGEFTLITTQFSPEFGHSSGGQFNTNIISGTNRLHGKAYEYFNNRNLNAAQVTGGTKFPNPRYDNNRFGGEVGGPILKDKLFFFGGYERQVIGRGTQINQCVPNASGRALIAAMQNAPGYSAVNVAQYLKYTPNATSSDTTQCGQDNTELNSGPSDENGIQTGTDQGTVGFGSYQVSASNFTNQDALVAGMDYTISPKDSFRGRYVYNKIGTEDISANLPEFWVVRPIKFHLIALSEFHSFTPGLTNEIRVGFNRHEDNIVSGNFSYPGVDSFPNLTFVDQGDINVGPDGNAPQFTIQNLYQLTDDVSYVKGKHTFKIGFDGRKFISPQGFTQRARGDYQWTYVSDFLHDYAPDANTAMGERSSGNHTYYGDQTALYGYVNDTFKMLPTLTLNLGARYEFTAVPVGERSQNLNAVASVPGLITFSTPQPSYKGIAPRVGFVFAPDSKTSIRAGFGLAYDVLVDNYGTLSFPPQFSTTQDVGFGSAPAYSSPNFLANGGLKPGTGSGTVVLDRADAIASTSAYVPNQTLPYSENYTLTIQREVAKGLQAEIGYIGNRGIHLPAQDRLNIQPKTNASNYLPTFANGVSINGKGTNATNLAAITANSNILPAYAAAGFNSIITSYQPYSGSNYNGLILGLQGRVHGVQTNVAYTWSKALDNATAEVFATSLTPRRPQNPRDFASEYSRSALDHTHRLTIELNYQFQPFSPDKSWLLRNLVGNWNVSPIYTYESPEYSTVLGGTNGLLTGDGLYVGRTIINPAGIKGTGSTVTPIKDANNATIGYQAVNPSAYYIQAAAGALPNASRNTLAGRPIDNIDFAAYKRITFSERYTLELGAQAYNVLNHAQYIPGYINDVAAVSYTGLTYTTVGNSTFNHPEQIFGNNPRSLQLSGKISF